MLCLPYIYGLIQFHSLYFLHLSLVPLSRYQVRVRFFLWILSQSLKSFCMYLLSCFFFSAIWFCFIVVSIFIFQVSLDSSVKVCVLFFFVHMIFVPIPKIVLYVIVFLFFFSSIFCALVLFQGCFCSFCSGWFGIKCKSLCFVFDCLACYFFVRFFLIFLWFCYFFYNECWYLYFFVIFHVVFFSFCSGSFFSKCKGLWF